MKTIVILLLSLLMSLPSHAWYPLSRNATPSEMGGGTQNWAVCQLPDGRMAFGNNNGLILYDGSKWLQLPVSNYTAVRSLCFDRVSQRLYVGASDEFGYFYTNPDNLHTEYQSLRSLLPRGAQSPGEIWRIHLLPHQIVFQGKHHLLLYDPSQHGTPLRVLYVPLSIDASAVLGGTLYVACPQGIYQLRHSLLTPARGTQRLHGQEIKALLPLDDNILVVTASGGLFVSDGASTRPYLPDLTPFLRSNTVFCASLRARKLVIGTVRHGAVVRDLDSGSTTYTNTSTGLTNNTVLSATIDRLGNVWLGLDNGAAYLLHGAPYASLLGTGSPVGTGYASLPQGDNLYLGTNQGLFVTSRTLSASATATTPEPVSGISGQVWNLHSTGGRLLCAADKGAYTVRGREARPIASTGGTWNFRDIPGSEGLVIASGYEGFYVLQPQGDGYGVRNKVEGFSMGSDNFEFDADGSLWVTHWQKGVYRLVLSADRTRFVEKKFFGRQHGLYVDEGNVVNKIGGRVALSSADGFHRYDAATGALTADTLLSAIFGHYGRGYQVIEMPGGDLWALSAQFTGVAHPQALGGWQVDTLSFDGVRQQLQIGLGHATPIGTDHIVLNSSDGFLVVNHRQAMTHARRQPIISKIVGTDCDTVLYMASLAQQPEELQIPHTLSSIRLEYALPEYRAGEAITYQYILEGYDKQWSPPTTQNSKAYTHLPRGTYHFRLRARNTLDGSTTEGTIAITILPAWYETWWAIAIYIVMAVVMARLVLKRLIRRANKQLLREREQQQQRIKEDERRIKEQQTLLEIEKEKREKTLITMRNEQLEQELKHKAQELTNSTMNIIRKNDMLQAIDQQMTMLADGVRQEQPKAQLVKTINEVRRDIKKQQKDDDQWERLAQNFNIVHHHFIETLTARYPQLKTNDIKLCVYLKMGLSSKEIASVMNTATRSIETARYRLRKKLELDNSESLTDFLQRLTE